VLYVAFILRFTAVSPIYYELDPYFYLYPTVQILHTGAIPPYDFTAWWPLVKVGHRTVSGLAFYQAAIYSLDSNSFDLYNLAFHASYYPPLAAMFMAFFAYLLFRERFSPAAGLVAALLFATTPVLMFKMYAGVFEAQPNSLMLHMAFIAAIYLSIKKKGIYKWLPLLIGLLYPLASTQTMVGIAFIGIATIPLILSREDASPIAYSSLAISLGGVFMSIFTSSYGVNTLPLKYMFFFWVLPLVLGATLLFKERLKDLTLHHYKKNANIVLPLIILASLAIAYFGFTFITRTISVGSYSIPLQRTIAEQQPAGSSLQGALGILSYDFYKGDVESFPLSSILALPAQLFEGIFVLFLKIMEASGSIIVYTQKIPSLIFYIFGFSLAFFIYELWRLFKRAEPDLVLWLASVFFLAISLVGLVMAKYIVHLALAAALASSYIIGYALVWLSKKFNTLPYLSEALFVVVAFAILSTNLISPFGITYISYAASMKPGFDPSLYNATFSPLCDESYCGLGNQSISFACSSNPTLCKFFSPSAPADVVCNNYDRKRLCSLAKGEASVAEQFSTSNCITYLAANSRQLDNTKKAIIRAVCPSTLPAVWLDSMDWISKNTPDDARITSWWDYGHWINYWGQRNAVLRNDHVSKKMIGDIAHAYLMANLSDFNNITKEYGSDYALFDREILFSGNAFGGKYYALNYLACARNNLTDVSKAQLESKCELDNLWEMVYTTNETCTISNISGITGKVGYSITGGLLSTADARRAKRLYCIAEANDASTGAKITISYYLNKTNDMGDLVLNKGILQEVRPGIYQVLYTKDKIWRVGNTTVSGWEDRKGRFYDSILYKAFVLEELPGWDLAYNNGYVKIYKRHNADSRASS
ncbi:MAG: hypothetical protein D6769_00290, partial [Methanobacteriota archaeon]